MSDGFVPIPVGELAKWIFGELKRDGALFGIPQALFWRPNGETFAMRAFGQRLDTPLGVAAGPHTQLAHNIVVAYLLGARFIELKTVQTLDQLEVSKPCIDAEDTTYNCEWSQELSLEQSMDEYVGAWVLIHALRHHLGWSEGKPELGCIFNASIGYNLQGIKNPNMQAFLAQLHDASELVARAVEEVARVFPLVRDLDIPTQLSDSVTLSTMHGCPPDEIEQIARYLIEERGLHTTVKLNPTLLGADTLRTILNDELGFKDIVVPDEAFEHDTKYPDALAFIGRLRDMAEKKGVHFGLKLTNTLEVQNHRDVFPPNEKMMYLSGRALHPLTINVAARLARDLMPAVPMSISGGADAFNLPQILACGLAPVTVCTDLLKPGGYTRLPQYLELLQRALREQGVSTLDALGADAEHALADYAKEVRHDRRYASDPTPKQAKDSTPLGFFDCIEPPCVNGCPTRQDIPEYLHRVAIGDLDGAMRVIRETNPLPQITGCVCDHVCESRCVRNHYDGAVGIRAIKRFVADSVGHLPPAAGRSTKLAKRVAIIGAGPAGLSCAYYLARAGFVVHLFDANEHLGGTVSATIPRFRITVEEILRDVQLVSALGIVLHAATVVGRDITFQTLQDDFDAVVIASGATAGRRMGIEGEQSEGVLEGYHFLEQVSAGRAPDLGKNVIVVGGGNAAMDAARTAWRLVEDGDVTVLYRRTRAQMPADPHEVLALNEEGIQIHELAAPLRVESDAGRIRAVVCQKMELAERDDSGRPRPSPIPNSEFRLPCSALLVCVSQKPRLEYLVDSKVNRTSWHTVRSKDDTLITHDPAVWVAGDATRGPDTVIQAIADGRQVALEIGKAAGIEMQGVSLSQRETSDLALRRLRAERIPRLHPSTLPKEHRKSFDSIEKPLTPEQARAEAARCLLCDEMCNLCVTVCPNMANLSYFIEPKSFDLPLLQRSGDKTSTVSRQTVTVRQRSQIVNITNFCNECANCTTFCPTAGAPYLDKPRLHLDQRSYDAEEDRAVFVKHDGQGSMIRLKIAGQELSLSRDPSGYHYISAELRATFDEDFKLIQATPQSGWQDATTVSLKPAAELAVLLEGLCTLPLPGLAAPHEDLSPPSPSR